MPTDQPLSLSEWEQLSNTPVGKTELHITPQQGQKMNTMEFFHAEHKQIKDSETGSRAVALYFYMLLLKHLLTRCCIGSGNPFTLPITVYVDRRLV